MHLFKKNPLYSHLKADNIALVLVLIFFRRLILVEQRLWLRAYSWGMVMQGSIIMAWHYVSCVFVEKLLDILNRIRVLFACVFLYQKSDILVS